MGISRSDTSVLQESVDAVLGKAVSDTARLLADTIQSAFSYRISDTPGLGDSVFPALGISRSDTSVLQESVEAVLGKAVSDAAEVIADSIQSVFAYGASDTPSLDESVLAALGFSRSDASIMQESVEAVLGKAVSDAAQLIADSIQSFFSYGTSDTPSLDESVLAALGFSRSDASIMQESVEAVLGKAVSDAAQLIADSIQSVFSYGTSDTPSLDESVLAVLGFSRSDGTSLTASFESARGRAESTALSIGETLASSVLGGEITNRRTVSELVAKDSPSSFNQCSPPGADLAWVDLEPASYLCCGLLTFECLKGYLSLKGGAVLLATLLLLLLLRAYFVILGAGTDLSYLSEILGPSHTPVDLASLADSLITALGLLKTDTASLVDSVAASLGISATDATTLVDSTRALLSKTPSDLASVGESIITALGLLKTDGSSLREAVTAALGFSLGDTTIVQESVEFIRKRDLLDSIGLSHGLSCNCGGGVVQAIVPLLETVIGELGHSEFDGAGVRESVFAALGFPRTETSSLGVSIGTVLRSALVNPATVKESVLFLVGMFETDSAGFSESVGAALGVPRSTPADLRDTIQTVLVSKVDTANPRIVALHVGRVGRDESSGASLTDRFGFQVHGVRADLETAISQATGTVVVGGEAVYTVVVTNNGPNTALGVLMVYEPPPNVLFKSAVATQGRCDEVSGLVECNLGNFPIGRTASLTITVIPSEGSGGTDVTNTATVSSGSEDLNSGNDSASLTSGITKNSDVKIVLSGPTNGVITGKNFAFSAVVTNGGPSKASEVILTAELPQEVNFISATPSQGLCTGDAGALTCELGDIANGADASVKILVTAVVAVASGDVETITNTMRVTAAETDFVLSNNVSTAMTTAYFDGDDDGIGDQVEDGAPNGGDGNNDGVPDKNQDHVSSLKNAIDGRYATILSLVGTELLDVEVIANPSPEDAPEEEFPAGFFSFTIGGLQTADATTSEIILPPGTLVASYWKYGPTPDNVLPHWYEFLFDGTTGAVITGSRVTLHLVDGQRGDNDVTENGEIVDPGGPVFSPADLSLTNTDSSDPVRAGDQLTYTLNVTNNGPSDATGVVLTDTLPSGVTLQAVNFSQGACTTQPGQVRCELGSISVGSLAAVGIRLIPDSIAGTTLITNTATVTAQEEDSDITNNTTSQDTRVTPVADISITTTDFPAIVAVGGAFTYSLTVINNGPSQVTGVVLTSRLPGRVIFQSATSTQESCIESNGTVLCHLGALDVGAQAVITMPVETRFGFETVIIANLVNVTGSEFDPSTLNNTEVEETTVQGPPPPPTATQADAHAHSDAYADA